MANINEILNWLRDPKNQIPETENLQVLGSFREKIADAFELKNSHPNIEEAIRLYASTPRPFRRVLKTVEITDVSQPIDLSWVEASKKRGRLYWQRLREYLISERGRAPESVIRLDDESENVLKYLANPNGERAARRGLVVGYVQSGKTANMAALMAKAADAGYKVFIVFAGVLDTLRQQTQLRFDQELTGGDSGTFVENWAALSRVPLWKESEYANWRLGTHARPFSPKEGEIKEERPTPALLKRDLGPILFVVKKTPTRINLLRSFLTESAKQYEQQNDFPLPTLIVDDESDQATINIQASRGDFAATNKAIRELLKVLRVHTYVGYTATPFANLLIDPRQRDDKYGRDLFPKDFIVSLKAPPGYFGTRELFGLSEDRDPEREHPGLPIFRAIDGKEALNSGKVSSTKSLREQCPRLGLALDSFILSCAARQLRGHGREDMSMLVHPSSYTQVQNNFADPIRKEVSRLQVEIKNGEKPSSLFSRLREVWEKDFVPTTTKINTALDSKYPAPNFSELEVHILDVISHIEVKVLHSGSKDYLQYFDKEHPKRYIVVGGNKLSRGLTVEGLSVSYFIRRSNSYDTLLQMGRWFGYRETFVDLTRLYMTAEARHNFAELAFVEMDLREQFAKYELEKIKPLEMPPRILQVPSMLVTARNRMGAGIQLEADFSDSVTQQTVFEFDQPDRIRERNSAILSFLQSQGTPIDLGEVLPDRMKQGAVVWPNLVSTEDLMNGLQTIDLCNLDMKLFREYALEKMSDCKWIVSIAGKEDGKPAGEFGFGSWSGRLVTVNRTIKAATNNNIRVTSSPNDLRLIDLYAHNKGLDTSKLGYLIVYLINPDVNELWKTSQSEPPKEYLANPVPFIAAPVFRIPKLSRGAIKVGLTTLSDEELDQIYRDEEAIEPDDVEKA